MGRLWWVALSSGSEYETVAAGSVCEKLFYCWWVAVSNWKDLANVTNYIHTNIYKWENRSESSVTPQIVISVLGRKLISIIIKYYTRDAWHPTVLISPPIQTRLPLFSA